MNHIMANIDTRSPEEIIINELFSDKELDAIEIAFEGVSFMNYLTLGEREKVLSWRKKLKQGNTEKGNKKALIAICNNIIKNNGEFIY
jgi:hypothetical protein